MKSKLIVEMPQMKVNAVAGIASTYIKFTFIPWCRQHNCQQLKLEIKYLHLGIPREALKTITEKFLSCDFGNNHTMEQLESGCACFTNYMVDEVVCKWPRYKELLEEAIIGRKITIKQIPSEIKFLL